VDAGPSSPDNAAPSGESAHSFGSRLARRARTVIEHVEPARLRGSEPPAAFAPSGPSGERDFLAERLALFGQVAFLASTGFFIMRVVLDALARPHRPSAFDYVPTFHAAATIILLGLWILAGSRRLSERALTRLDEAATIGASLGYAMMAWTMPLAWRSDQLVLLILNALLLGRAALVPSDPRRTAWISAASVAAVPGVAWLLFHGAPSRAISAGSAVTQATLWAAFTVVLATLISNVTFHLRRSIARVRRLGQYRILEKIGEGGMGVVYRAEHEMLKRPTAIKLLAPQSAGEQNLRRFEREARLTARLTNPHTVTVYDFGRTPEGAFYYVMEYLDGVDLERMVRDEGPLPSGRVLHILRQVCEALAEAHALGLIHRDIKPGNILLSEWGGEADYAKVVDFGLVKDVTAEEARITRDDVFPGTLHYLAPETIQDGGSADPRSDLYSLGAVAYDLLTATPVFDGRPIEVIESHLHKSPEPPSARLRRSVPAKLEGVVLACLEKDPNLRPQSAKELSERLAACDDVEPWSADEARQWWRRKRTA
jgi:eukaryotic-like serine/threonine-protein kinase